MRSQIDHTAADLAARLRLVSMLLSADTPARVTLRDALPWMSSLPSEDVDAMIDELIDTAWGAVTAADLAPIATLLKQWRNTAEIHADPRLYGILTRELEGDLGSVVAPELDEILDVELPRYAEALRRLGGGAVGGLTVGGCASVARRSDRVGRMGAGRLDGLAATGGLRSGGMADRPGAEELLELALEVAAEAADLVVRGRAGDVAAESTKSSPTDVVTALDRASEELVARRLREARPDDGLLGEEGSDAVGTSGVRWVVDPIDGTVNFLYNLPNWAVSLAAEVDGEVVAGVVLAPALGRTYTALRGGGAALDGKPLRVSSVESLDMALIATGFGYTVERRTAQINVLTRVIPKVRDIRRMGAASLDLCAVAAGTLDGYYERGLKPWDHAAGGLIAIEAGAVTGGLDGAPGSEDLYIAAPPAIFGPLVALLAEEPRADRDS